MEPSTPTVTVREVHFNVLPMQTRFPFQYGIASMTALPHLFVSIQAEIDGKQAVGIASEGLPPKWFTKNPGTTFEEDLPAMLDTIRNAAGIAVSIGTRDSVFDWWMDLYAEQMRWACDRGIPGLLANLGVSLMERALLDALCRHLGEPAGVVVRANLLGIRLGKIHPELADREPCELLPKASLRQVAVRHTVGLGDPLSESDIENPIHDGLPVSLEANVAAYGLRYFKIKLGGNLEEDLERLRRVHAILEHACSGDYRFTLDGNEQFRDVATFADHWRLFQAETGLAGFWDKLLFVEQPLHRDVALADAVKMSLANWEGAPPMIIDESDAEIGSLPLALKVGYSGTSHKNCKGIVKGLANAALLFCRQHQRPGRDLFLSGEDLANVGPVALLQDLAMAAMLGIQHVERNGHHYFKGLSHLGPDLQSEVLEQHGDLYSKHGDGFAVVRIDDGKVSIRSVVDAPFGVRPFVDASTFVTLDRWEADGARLD